MTARQPGLAAKVPRSARKRGRCGEQQRKQWLPSCRNQHAHFKEAKLVIGNPVREYVIEPLEEPVPKPEKAPAEQPQQPEPNPTEVPA
jgi:hypothetical protein